MQRFWHISSSGSGAQYSDEGAWCCSIQCSSWCLHAVPWHYPWDWYIHTRAWLFARTVLSKHYPGTCAFRPCSCVFLRKPFPMLAMSTKVDCSLRASITTFALNSGVSFLRVVWVFIASAKLQNLFDLCTGSKKWEYYNNKGYMLCLLRAHIAKINNKKKEYWRYFYPQHSRF